MKPAIQRTIITSPTTARRYFLVYSSHRPAGRRHYVCSKPDCPIRVTRDSTHLCPTHSQPSSTTNESLVADTSTKSDSVSGDLGNGHNEIIDEQKSTEITRNTNSDSNDEELQNESEINDSTVDDEFNSTNTNGNTSLPILPQQKVETSRQIDVTEDTGVRTLRDSSGRPRYLCSEASCTTILKCSRDIFCRKHALDNTETTDEDEMATNCITEKRRSAPPVVEQTKERFPSPFQTATISTEPAVSTTNLNGSNGNHSEEYESPQKANERPRSDRSFRDAAGKLRFRCAISTCNSRVVRHADTYCKRHQTDDQSKAADSTVPSTLVNRSSVDKKEENDAQEMNVNNHQIDGRSEEVLCEPSMKKRKQEMQTLMLKPVHFSSVTANKIVIATTTLLDDQWTKILTFLRQFPQVKLSTNLNVNNSTSHLLVDDSENHSHCTITKKIVQAAARRHIFIISSRWVDQCLHSKIFVDERPYEITSDSHTILRLSVQNFQVQSKYLFANSTLKYVYGFAIECRQCQGSINRNELIELIELTGAKVYDHQKAIDILIVLCDTNEKNLGKIKEKYQHTSVSTIKYVTSDFLLKSIIKFEIQDIDKYSL